MYPAIIAIIIFVIINGTMIAGLCASGGLGLLVLFKEEKDKKEVLRILFLLFGISVLAGYTIQYVIPFTIIHI